MNDQPHSVPDAPESEPRMPGGEQVRPVDVSRRRFARGGAAASVVLGSLVSRPVLGAAPYHCTVSGHVSGDASPHPDSALSCVIGDSRSDWIANSWPSAIEDKGELPNTGCNFNGGNQKGTLFNGFGSGLVTGGLAATFFYRAGAGSCNITLEGTTSTAASLYQVLVSTATGDVFDLGRATVVSLLNYYKYGETYPVSAARIIHMFNETSGGGSYRFNATVTWSRSQVIAYLTSLYPPD